MATFVSKYSDGQLPIVVGDCAGEVIANHYEFDITGVNLALNDVIDLGVLSANATVVDAILVCDDLDTGTSAALALDVGIMSGEVGTTGTRTVGNEMFAASTVAQAGGTERMSKAAGFRIAKVGYDRSIGVKIQTAAATEAASGKIGLIVFTAQ